MSRQRNARHKTDDDIRNDHPSYQIQVAAVPLPVIFIKKDGKITKDPEHNTRETDSISIGEDRHKKTRKQHRQPDRIRKAFLSCFEFAIGADVDKGNEVGDDVLQVGMHQGSGQDAVDLAAFDSGRKQSEPFDRHDSKNLQDEDGHTDNRPGDRCTYIFAISHTVVLCSFLSAFRLCGFFA